MMNWDIETKNTIMYYVLFFICIFFQLFLVPVDAVLLLVPSEAMLGGTKDGIRVHFPG